MVCSTVSLVLAILKVGHIFQVSSTDYITVSLLNDLESKNDLESRVFFKLVAQVSDLESRAYFSS